MGKRDKRRKKDPSAKARDATKVSEKAARKEERKARKKVTGDDSDEWSDDGQDLEAIVRGLEAQSISSSGTVDAVSCAAPSPRSSSQFVANPLNGDEVILFAGEFFDGKSTTLMYNDLLVFNVVKGEWRLLSPPSPPTPRSSHQLVATPSGKLFLFGGEFSSKSGSKFFHHKDFWTLDARTWQWSKMNGVKAPSPRSGHRMVYFHHHILMFGGFNDDGRTSTYLDDLWCFYVPSNAWRQVEVPFQYNKPSARSGVQFILLSETVEKGQFVEAKFVLFGGYTKEVVKVPGRTPRDKPRNKLIGRVHNDMWLLTVSSRTPSETSTTPDVKNTSALPHPELDFKWSKLRQSTSASISLSAGAKPPHIYPRSSPSLVSARGRLVLFGGVFDAPESEDGDEDEDLRGECTSDCWTCVVVGDTGVWYPGRIESQKGSPVGRYGAAACVQKNNLYIFSGLHEPTPSTLLCFDDLWSLPLDRLLSPTGAAAEWRCIKPLSVTWVVKDDAESEDEEVEVIVNTNDNNDIGDQWDAKGEKNKSVVEGRTSSAGAETAVTSDESSGGEYED
ncbi:hypothetical protein HDU93_007391 [Gonapodya sp. JEL0774]|nr:hypothetical protein HDU93_007391 [Gonapodya sp. JEL0774]